MRLVPKVGHIVSDIGLADVAAKKETMSTNTSLQDVHRVANRNGLSVVNKRQNMVLDTLSIAELLPGVKDLRRIRELAGPV